ncbi:bifunctional nitrate reductase/sulfite reductase flavoprotein subunit alpha [Cellulomonas fimi]|uniref:assimilatory sulfite reductase (NADPH) n=1 Tax=Cellulomonas fimi (strain ATCC 484 / DSM 20113 / JCM 1341 / CCUG 24087 / LMG 16345 / NBRC 15513 / NCIMB 8980 / NCTC 7547 / NRS-133) TaxID=590998 RepID=F4H441_CELFA|nr:bifunctional nitrate reductase/sulfite reductase flavoprotein subunit alpha [Cellulomonas fimi]AEE45393.1 molybdopterin oxidoreductase [Cellulomonas fimi ATCC 484]NNH06854.1 molybdopterin-dependent oxidoreductase [Cellulomonas fimi]VEH29236.1 Nitrate reductase [Cellulomonas fimi]
MTAITTAQHEHTSTTQVATVCSYCGVGCGVLLDVVDDASGRTVRKASGDRAHPSNAGRLCTKGATSADLFTAGGRLSTALVRAERGAEPAPVGVDDAIATVAARLRAIVDEHGADAVALYVSGQMSIEAQYLANKLAKGYLRTNQIESNSRLCMASAGTGYKLSLGADGPPGSYEDLDHADVFLVIGANMADCHPILFLRLLDRVKAGAKLIVVDPRRTATADKADLFLQVRPGSDIALLNGLLHLLVEAGAVDEEFVAEHTEGWDAMPAFLADYPPDLVAQVTGVPEADLRAAAAMLAGTKDWVSCWTMGLNQSTHGTWNTNALVNLHLATGAIGRRGAGPFSLTGQPNAMGGREMGYMGPGLPGQRSVLDPADRAFVEDLWDLPEGTIRADGVGRGTVEMFERMAAGEIKACWVICTNPVASVANRRTVIEGLERAELVVTQDVFADTETNAYADVVLPAAMWSEADGVMVNSERTMTLARRALDPPGEALPDWLLIARVATAMGFDGFGHTSSREVFDEIRRTTNPRTGYDLRGVSYDRLLDGPVQWPAAPDGPARNPLRYLNDGVSQPLHVRPDGTRPRLVFPTPSGRAVFHPRPHLPAAELPDDDYPFLLNTGRVQHQWHTLTKTGKVPRLTRLNPGPFVELHPDDATRLGVRDGASVEVASRRGRAVLPAVVTERVRPGALFAPFHWNDLFGEYLSVNAVTNDAVDPLSFQPELKVCAVSLTLVAPPPEEPAGTPSAVDADRGEPALARATSEDRATGAGLVDALPDTAPASDGASAMRALAAALGLDDFGPPVLGDDERRYLAGFLAGLGGGTPGTPVLPPTAPLDGTAALWVDGLLAGMFSRAPEQASRPGAVAPPAPVVAPPRPLVVLWASQTGNAEELAAQVAARLSDAGRAPQVLAMDEAVGALPRRADLVVVTSTFSDGDAPDNGAAFWEALADPEAQRLDGARFAVLALGDSSYDQFCGHGRRVDRRLAELGAERLVERADCEPGDDDTARAWIESAVAALTAPDGTSPAAGVTAPGGPVLDGTAPGGPVLDGPVLDRTVLDGPVVEGPVVAGADGRRATAAAPAAAGDLSVPHPASAREPGGEAAVVRATRSAPGRARLVGNRLLNLPGSAKEVRELWFDTSDSPALLEYAAGDALAIRPVNSATLVEEWLAATGVDAGAPVEVDGVGTRAFADALRTELDVTRASQDLLRFVADRSGSERLRRLLRADNRNDLAKWLWGRQAVDVVAEFGVQASAQEWATVLRRLQPRQYSISSSPLVDPHRIRLTVSVVRYDGPTGAARGGVCSSFLADAGTDVEVAAFVQPSAHFHPPQDPTVPMVMVGPGTGVAPFLGFLAERRALGHSGDNWLFFGEQHAATDFYYRDELDGLRDDGLLTRLDTAFSRDQRSKVYVQDRMREHGPQLWSWLERGAHLYVCGDASRMAKDVDATLREVVAVHGGLDADGASAYVKRLTTDRRYARDVY